MLCLPYLGFFDLLLEGHPNCMTGSKFTAILLNGWILPIGAASAVEGPLSTGPTPSSLIVPFPNSLIKKFLNLIRLVDWCTR